jgi:hypothetical protein
LFLNGKIQSRNLSILILILPNNNFTTFKHRLVKLDIQTKEKNIGYIKGAGDEVELNLEST